MAPFPQLSAMFGAASPFGCAVRSMNAGNQRQDDAPSNPSIKHAVAALMGGNNNSKVVPAAPAEGGIKMYSQEYYMTCALGGIVSCGATHTAVTPLDVVKCNIQTNPAKYKGISSGFSILLKEQGPAGLFRGWLPTLMGYSAQGAFKFGLYEYFKKTYADMAGEELVAKYQTLIFLAGSASAEFFADMALSPFEAVKVAVQTRPGFAKGLTDGMPKLIQQEGAGTLFKSLVPLWGRQIPYTMMKFGAFENTVQALYKYVVPKPREECTKTEQLTVSFAAGYIAGVFCAVVSHPADNLVSKLNAQKGATVGDIVKQMGWYALATRGLGLRIIMIGTLTGLQWGIYDSFKVAAGLPTTGAKVATPAK
ncbi:mitochondrial carrier protein [Scenedesmus sp. NREL 46B-D3]|nr:mitochondrial carrier protein [Scenedesmus sp. NREL 46B-D3]